MKEPNAAPIYVSLYGAACEVARGLGYALAVHGTLGRDLDLLAAPWTDEAAPPEALAEALAARLAWLLDGDKWHLTGPVRKPHGRLAWSIPYLGHWQIDLSVMPRVIAGKGEG